MRPYQPSAPQPGIVNGPSRSDLLSSYIADRSKSVTRPVPSHVEHIPPSTLKVRFSLTFLPPRSIVTAPAPLTDATLNENAFGEPMCGSPSLLNRMRSIAPVSVAVPTVD